MEWQVKISNKIFLRSKNLILTSSLIAHPRCLEILNTHSLPLRDAFILGQDKVVDSILIEARKLTYIRRKVYIRSANFK